MVIELKIKLNLLILIIVLLVSSCSYKCNIVKIENRKTAEKRLENEIQKFDKNMQYHYSYLKNFIDELIASGNNYINYLENNKWVDCSEVIAVLNSDRKSNLNLRKEYRDTFDQYFQKISIDNTYIYGANTIDMFNVDGDILIQIVCNKIDDIIMLGFNIPKNNSNNKKNDYRLLLLYSYYNTFGFHHKEYDTDSVQEQCEYLKVFFKELMKNRNDYWNYLLNNNLVKLDKNEIERYSKYERLKNALDDFFFCENINEKDIGENFRLKGKDRLLTIIPVYCDNLYITVQFIKQNNNIKNNYTYIIEHIALESSFYGIK